MASLVLEFDARDTVLGRYLGPGTPYFGMGLLDPVEGGFDLRLDLVAPDTVVGLIQHDFEERHGLTVDFDAMLHGWRNTSHLDDRKLMQEMGFSDALWDLHGDTHRVYTRIGDGRMTTNIATQRSVDQLEPWRLKVEQKAAESKLDMHVSCRRSIELTSEWAPILMS